MLDGAGPDLDRQIERKLNGDAKKKTPPYSTSEKAANRLMRRLEMQDMPCSIEQIDGVWFCTLWILHAGGRERLSTGSGETRALSIARTVLNARLGMNTGISSAAATVSRRVHRALVSSPSIVNARPCDGCGVALPTRYREATNRLCSVCSWRAARRPLTPAAALPGTPGSSKDEEA
jgi:hypothetical protein